jgi:membrane-bound lytic murein transglycosylase D
MQETSSDAMEAALDENLMDDLTEEESEEFISELDDAEFCKDNIYAQYLKEEYLKTHKAVPQKRIAQPKRRRGRRYTSLGYNQREVEALFHARLRLTGETAPYFGGIPVVTNPKVEYWIRFFKTVGRKSFLRWLVRGESVRDVVLPILQKQGLPPEFIYLSMVESGFSNQAYSSAKATGPWQFMQGTARLYGLRIDSFVDERRDPVKSTLAAAKHLSDLYQEFGDWYLAMAAYNAGTGRIRGAIRAGRTSNFWELADSPYLPVETKHYVAKVLAALILSSNPAGHGFQFSGDVNDQLPISTAAIKDPVLLSDLATALHTDERSLKKWNPELVSGIVPARRDGYSLRLTPKLADLYATVAESLPKMQLKEVLSHKIKRGDTLASIAARYRVTLQNLKAHNPGLSPSRLRTGRYVNVPVSAFVPRQTASASRNPG